MKEWLKISGLLCIFGFIREIRPSEPYVTEYLLGPWRNITQEELVQEALPIATYSYLAQLVLIFLITDFLRYKPLIIVIGLSGIIVYSLLIWTTSLLWLQIVEFVYGTYMAAEVAYYTYIYAKVDKKYYPKVTSHTRAAMFLGKLVASITSQILINFKWMDYKQLNYITLATQITCTLWAFALPSVKTSLYFHRETNMKTKMESQITDSSQIIVNQNKNLKSFQLLWSHFINAYSNINVIKWSIWYGLALCGYLQITNYIQVLWKDIDENPNVAWNGAVDAVLTLAAAIFALLAGYFNNLKLTRRTNLFIISIFFILKGAAIFLATWPMNLYCSYVGYILYGTIYAFTITVASAEVAHHLEEDSFGLVFGINTLLALVLQTLMTLIFVSGSAFTLSVTQQFTTYGFYFILTGIIYCIILIFEYMYQKRHEANVQV